ncbi:MAG: transporter ATP-binding protein [Rhizobacter sp.]|nr:transporter ATP-binding protein [Rhizobacter sp.]
MARLLEVEALETAYGRSQVLFGLDFGVDRGEVVGLMGRNGMGKTTTIRSIMGLVPPIGGRVRFDGEEYQRQPAFRVARAGVALVPEGRQVFRQLSVREHLQVARADRRHADAPWTLERVFGLFPRLAERASHLGGQLSGGEQQMLAIGRALMTNPQLILFDEATEGLAPLVRQEIWAAVGALKRSGCAILLVDKNVADVARVADRMLVLEKGRLGWSGTSAELQGDTALQHRFLGV